jgi:PAS domain S-box-containing protein
MEYDAGDIAPPKNITIPDDVLGKWQSIVDTMAALVDVPAGLVMRIIGDQIEVLVSSAGKSNPYTVGASEHLFGSGLYCETVIRSGGRLLVPNALDDPDWENNPDVKLDMLSYLGLPIVWPDSTPFGTICVLDSKTNTYNETYEKLIRQFRDMIEHHLSLIHREQQHAQQIETNLRTHARELRISEERFRALAENAADDFILHDDRGRILDVNEQACRNLGLNRTALLRMGLDQLPFDFGEDWERLRWGAMSPNDTATVRGRYRRVDGALRQVEMNVSCHDLGGLKCFFGLVRDATDRLQSERTLRAAEAALAQASRQSTAGRLASSIAHELNQPLAAIEASAEACSLWLSRPAPNLTEANAAIERLVAASRRATAVVGGLRTIARQTKIALVELDVGEIVNEVVLMARADLDRYEAATVVRTSGDTRALGDRIQIQQVLLNLIRNAAEAMGDTVGPRTITISLARDTDGDLVVAVDDAGPGLDQAMMAKLFRTPFTTKPHGMGLGVSICRSIVEAHGRTLQIGRSTFGGVRFHFALPTPPSNAAPLVT